MFYVYVMFRPNGVPCYVGKGSGRRDGRHEGFSRHPNAHLRSIIRLAGGSIPCVRVREGLSEDEAFKIERVLIATIGRECNGGPLINQTDGGEGAAGYRHTEATKAICKEASKRRGRAVWTKESLALMGRRVSESLKGKPKSEAHRLAVGAALKVSPCGYRTTKA